MLDITTTPDSEFTTLSKGMWLLICGAFWIFGATAWLLVGRPQAVFPGRRSPRYRVDGLGPAEAFMRHPAAQAAVGYAEQSNWLAALGVPEPLGPDDDEDFLLELDRRIREARGEE